MTDQPTMSVPRDGAQEWRLPSGRLHRDDGPAITYPDGYEAWYQHGKRHRDDGPAITRPDGDEEWFQHGQRHRVDGPALVYSNGTGYWYQHDQRHRVGGPAVTYLDGTREWWINGVQVTEFEHAVVVRAHALAEQGRPDPMPQS